MRISRLYKGKLLDTLNNAGTLKGIQERCTGETVGKALRLIGAAMAGKITVTETDKSVSELHLVVKALIKKLELQHLVVFVTGAGVSVEYRIFMEADEIYRELAGL